LVAEIPILNNIHIHGRFHKLVLGSPELALLSKPGQFLHLQVADSIQPLLRRPFSIYKTTKTSVEILYEVIGLGTEILSKRKAGELINSHGPLGNSFSESLTNKKPLLVGGGIGIAPLLFLGERLIAGGLEPEAILGFRTVDDIVGTEDFEQAGIKCQITTNDGSYGLKGFVTDAMDSFLDSDHKVFCCGPVPMLAAISDLSSQRGTECEVSIHNFMGCGFGACLGCVFPTEDGYKRVCKDGPVFDSKNLVFG